MMLSVKGEFHNGVAQPISKIEGREGQQVIITFLEDLLPPLSKETPLTSEKIDAVNGNLPNDTTTELDDDPLLKLIAECAVDTGIGDLAHEHDHYLYGTPKRGDYGK